MKVLVKKRLIGIFIIAGLMLFSCHSKNNENTSQDSLYQDSTYQDSIEQDSTGQDSVRKEEPENPVDELLQEDSLSGNNRNLRTP